VRRAGRGRELLSVGDRDHALLTVPLRAGGAGARANDLEGLAGDAGPSGFEGVACDGAGRVLVLQECTSRVPVLAAGFASLEAVVELAVAPGQPGFGREWADDENACGEGLLLMARGHLLVAKQKAPVCLIEFGVVSSRSRRIARIGRPLDAVSHEARIDDDWRLPDIPGAAGPAPRPSASSPRRCTSASTRARPAATWSPWSRSPRARGREARRARRRSAAPGAWPRARRSRSPPARP
jgi:hypothetical protein